MEDESIYLFDKRISCPVCGVEFKTKQVKTGKARFLGTDDDLRPRYSGIDTIKYDVYFCPHCGYASMSREFNNVTGKQIKLLREKIGSKFHESGTDEKFYSYDIAIKRYKMALLTAITKPARLSESSYLCLKLAWLYRGAANERMRVAEELILSVDGDQKQNITIDDVPAFMAEQIRKYNNYEKQYIKEAYDGFSKAITEEYPPICNMDEMTLDFLLAQLAFKCDDYEDSVRYAYMVVSGRNASSKLKDKARELVNEAKKKKE